MTNSQSSLLKASYQYIDFVNRIGRGDSFAQLSEAAHLFAPKCKKVFNGNLVVENRDKLVKDLLSVYENYGSWKHALVDMIDASTTKAIIIRTMIETERLGTNTAIVILRFDSDGLISEINEVFSLVKSLEFEKK